MKSASVSREVFIAAPAKTCVMAGSFYTQRDGLALGSFHWQLTRSDTIDIAFSRFSSDNGRTWTASQQIATREDRPGGVLRRFVYPGYFDAHSGKLLFFWMEGLLPEDSPIKDGVRQWYLRLAVSEDGGKTRCVDEPIICEGAEFSASHPLPGHYVGKNATQIGATTCVPLTLADGTILVPCQMSPLGDDGEYFNPGGGYSYKEALVLRGTWNGNTLEWNAGERVVPDARRTTRGMLEPTLGLLGDGRVLIVMRGSNDVRPELPGIKWFSISGDGARTWSAPASWTFDDGEEFFSPSSCSQLLAHSGGKLLWLGNIAPENPQGNAPRYPLVMGEVDLDSGLLKRDSIRTVDTRQEGESEALQLSNFYAREDRATGNIIVHCTRLFPHQKPGAPLDWSADALQYSVPISL